MLMSFDETSAMILSGKLLHIAGAGNLIGKLPKGNWIGGSTEYFMAKSGGIVTDSQLFVTELLYDTFKIATYDEKTISNVTADAFDNGFSLLILPFDSAIHMKYAAEAPGFEGMFIKNIAGWISGVNLGVPGQKPIAVNGQTGETFRDKAVALHVCVPDDKIVSIGIVNIFSQDENSPIIEFLREGFSGEKCLVNGNEVVLADYIEQNGIDTKYPLVGDYSGANVNVSFKAIEDGTVSFYAPVFPGIKYKKAKLSGEYVAEFCDKLENLCDADSVFSCNCILNFLYGELEGKEMGAFFGPITFGEIAYQLVNQTLVYVTVV